VSARFTFQSCLLLNALRGLGLARVRAGYRARSVREFRASAVCLAETGEGLAEAKV